MFCLDLVRYPGVLVGSGKKIRVSWSDLGPGILVGSGQIRVFWTDPVGYGCFGRIRSDIRVFWSDPVKNPGVLVRSGSRCFGRVRSDSVVLVGSGPISGCFGRFWSDPDVLVGSGKEIRVFWSDPVRSLGGLLEFGHISECFGRIRVF